MIPFCLASDINFTRARSRQISNCLLVSLALLFGCRSPHSATQPVVSLSEGTAIVLLGEFNPGASPFGGRTPKLIKTISWINPADLNPPAYPKMKSGPLRLVGLHGTSTMCNWFARDLYAYAIPGGSWKVGEGWWAVIPLGDYVGYDFFEGGRLIGQERFPVVLGEAAEAAGRILPRFSRYQIEATGTVTDLLEPHRENIPQYIAHIVFTGSFPTHGGAVMWRRKYEERWSPVGIEARENLVKSDDLSRLDDLQFSDASQALFSLGDIPAPVEFRVLRAFGLRIIETRGEIVLPKKDSSDSFSHRPTPEVQYPSFTPKPLDFTAMQEKRWIDAFASFEAFANPIPPRALEAWLALEIPEKYGQHLKLEQWLLNGYLAMDQASDADPKMLELIHQITQWRTTAPITKFVLDRNLRNRGPFFADSNQYPPQFPTFFSDCVLTSYDKALEPLHFARGMLRVEARYPNSLHSRLRFLRSRKEEEDYSAYSYARVLVKELGDLEALAKTNSEAKKLLRSVKSISGILALKGLKPPTGKRPGGVVGGVVGGTGKIRDVDWSEARVRYAPPAPRELTRSFPSKDKDWEYLLTVHWKVSAFGTIESIEVKSLNDELNLNRAPLLRTQLETWAKAFAFEPARVNGVPFTSDQMALIRIPVRRRTVHAAKGDDLVRNAELLQYEWLRPPSYESRWMPVSINPWGLSLDSLR